ncbi:MAG: hypothetical protein V1917_02535 [Candidatus Gottesmanbacteria bacterium]
MTNLYHIDDMKKLIKNVLKEERVATKDDLKGFATKDDLKNYANKDDLISFKDEILHELQGIRVDMDILTEYKDQIEDHDVRIERLEKHPHLTQPIA